MDTVVDLVVVPVAEEEVVVVLAVGDDLVVAGAGAGAQDEAEIAIGRLEAAAVAAEEAEAEGALAIAATEADREVGAQEAGPGAELGRALAAAAAATPDRLSVVVAVAAGVVEWALYLVLNVQCILLDGAPAFGNLILFLL